MSETTTHRAYCSACDREVEVMLDPAFPLEPGEPIPAEAMLCLDHGDVCTGALCPLFGIPPQQIKTNLDRSGTGNA